MSADRTGPPPHRDDAPGAGRSQALPRGATRAEVIADTALALLAERGMRGLTHRAVDAAAGLPPGSTSNHARTRAALLGAAVRRLAVREAEVLAPDEAPWPPDASPGHSGHHGHSGRGSDGGDRSGQGPYGRARTDHRTDDGTGRAHPTGGGPPHRNRSERSGSEPAASDGSGPAQSPEGASPVEVGGEGPAAGDGARWDRDALADALSLALHRSLTRQRALLVARYELALEATRRPELREHYDAAGRGFRETLVALMTAAGSADPARHALSLLAWCEGLMFSCVAGADHATVPGREELRAGFAELLRGMLGDDGRSG